jgi:hypothetical protein
MNHAGNVGFSHAVARTRLIEALCRERDAPRLTS